MHHTYLVVKRARPEVWLFLLQSEGSGAAAGEGFDVMRQRSEIP